MKYSRDYKQCIHTHICSVDFDERKTNEFVQTNREVLLVQ